MQSIVNGGTTCAWLGASAMIDDALELIVYICVGKYIYGSVFSTVCGIWASRLQVCVDALVMLLVSHRGAAYHIYSASLD